jgi:pyruvate kinase
VPVHVADDPGDWRETAAAWVHGNGLGPRLGILVQGPSRKRPDALHRIELVVLGSGPAKPQQTT